MLELMLWAPTLQTIIDGMVKYGFGSYVTNSLTKQTEFQPHPEAQMDVIGDIVISKGVTTGGVHVNMRGWGGLEAQMTKGLPQTDGKGQLLPLFERTHILDFIPGIKYTPLPIKNSSLASGYMGPDGVLLFDPAMIVNRRRIWA